MDLIARLQSGIDRLGQTSYFRNRMREQAKRVFAANRDDNMFLGVYDSWAAASAAAEAFGKVGYDDSESAAIYDHRTRIDTHDYPALTWLLRSMQDGMRTVGDVGGGIGIKFIAFRDALQPWPQLEWTVHDVAAVLARGRKLAASRGDADRLHFADQFEALGQCDILFASGVLQYLPATLGETLAGWRERPRRIVINTTPIHPGQAFFTVNSIGTAYCPYRVQTQAGLVRELTALGYKVRESWINPSKLMTIPQHPEYSLQHYSGFCLDRRT